MNRRRLQFITITALVTAMLCIAAPWSIPVGVIPISLASFFIYLIGGILPPKIAVTAVVFYILIGCIGLPVFSGFLGGFSRIVSATGGFIVGYIPCIFIISLLTTKKPSCKLIYPLSMIAGTAICYVCAAAWFVVLLKADFAQAVSVCILPFLIGDTLKITIASLISPIIRRRICIA